MMDNRAADIGELGLITSQLSASKLPYDQHPEAFGGRSDSSSACCFSPLVLPQSHSSSTLPDRLDDRVSNSTSTGGLQCVL